MRTKNTISINTEFELEQLINYLNSRFAPKYSDSRTPNAINIGNTTYIMSPESYSRLKKLTSSSILN